MRHPTLSDMAWLASLVGRSPKKTGTNPNKPKLVKVTRMSKMDLGAKKQTQWCYLDWFQYDGEKKRPFFEQNGWGIPQFLKDASLKRCPWSVVPPRRVSCRWWFVRFSNFDFRLSVDSVKSSMEERHETCESWPASQAGGLPQTARAYRFRARTDLAAGPEPALAPWEAAGLNFKVIIR